MFFSNCCLMVQCVEWQLSYGTTLVEIRTSTSSSALNQSIRSGEMSRCVSSKSIMMNRFRSSSERISCFTAASLHRERKTGG